MPPKKQDDPNSELGDPLFHWKHESDSDSNPYWGLDGVGHTARRIVENFMQRHPNEGIDKLNDIFGTDTVFPEGSVPDDPNRYFPKHSVDTNQGRFYITNQWGAKIRKTEEKSKRWRAFLETAESRGYTISECRFVTIRDSGTRDWKSYRYFGFLSASGESEGGRPRANAIKKLPVGTIVFAFLLSDSSEKGRFVGMGEVTAEACRIGDFKYKGTKLLDCVDESGEIYKEKFKEAQKRANDDNKCEWCLGVRWMKAFSREEGAEGKGVRGHIVRKVIPKASRKNIKAKFEAN